MITVILHLLLITFLRVLYIRILQISWRLLYTFCVHRFFNRCNCVAYSGIILCNDLVENRLCMWRANNSLLQTTALLYSLILVAPCNNNVSYANLPTLPLFVNASSWTAMWLARHSVLLSIFIVLPETTGKE